VVKAPTIVQFPVAGSYNSVVVKKAPLYPPVTNTFPLFNTDAVRDSHEVLKLPVVTHTK
ncbi:unnamed protein product, partial [Adineta steineri]